MLAKAIKIASAAFENKKDKAGKPYILHCLRVMAGVNQSDSELMQIAVLHDIIEDTYFKPTDLIKLGFSPRVISAVELLTHKKGVPYMNYIKAISFNEDARAVKLADLKDNSDITRLKGLRQKDFERMEKYHQAFIYLSN